jgi:oxygen-independent coproporphyrinogen-3 oxidase
VRALLAEAERRAPERPRTLFVGGGTPSILAPDELVELFEGLERRTGFRSSAAEVTVECNPESLDREKADCLRALGATRLSIGFQSLRPGILATFGRAHGVEQSFRAFAAARAAGFARVSVDLIFAAPGLSSAAWEEDLGQVLALGPEHLSAYALTYEQETLFHRWLEEGRLARVEEELELEQFRATRRLCAAAGLEAYEVSNFARAGERCAHNVNYWRNGAYVGIGPGAVSKLGRTRSGNPRALKAWTERALAGQDPAHWTESPPDGVRLGETWWLGLRLAEGLSAAEARRRAEVELADEALDPARGALERLEDQGLLARRGERFALSERGLELADHVARVLLEACAELDGPEGSAGSPRSAAERPSALG